MKAMSLRMRMATQSPWPTPSAENPEAMRRTRASSASRLERLAPLTIPVAKSAMHDVPVVSPAYSLEHLACEVYRAGAACSAPAAIPPAYACSHQGRPKAFVARGSNLAARPEDTYVGEGLLQTCAAISVREDVGRFARSGCHGAEESGRGGAPARHPQFRAAQNLDGATGRHGDLLQSRHARLCRPISRARPGETRPAARAPG